MAAAIGGLGVNGNCSSSALPLTRFGWPSGTSIDSEDTLKFAVLTGVRSRNEVFPLERAPEA